MVDPPYRPAPKSGCMGVLTPLKLMSASELGSTEELDMSWFHALSAGKGIKPFRLAPRPRLMPLQEFWAYSGEHRSAADKAKSNPRRGMKPPAGEGRHPQVTTSSASELTRRCNEPACL